MIPQFRPGREDYSSKTEMAAPHANAPREKCGVLPTPLSPTGEAPTAWAGFSHSVKVMNNSGKAARRNLCPGRAFFDRCVRARDPGFYRRTTFDFLPRADGIYGVRGAQWPARPMRRV